MTVLRDFVSPATDEHPRAVWVDGLKMYVSLGTITLDEAKRIASADDEGAVRDLLDKIERA